MRKCVCKGGPHMRPGHVWACVEARGKKACGLTFLVVVAAARVGDMERRVGKMGRRAGEMGRRVGEMGRRAGEMGRSVGEMGRSVGEMVAART